MEILFGPYGCLLSSLGISSDPATFNHQEKKAYRKAVESIAKGYLNTGATLPTVNAFFLRTLLKKGLTELYKEFFRINLEALLSALGNKLEKRIAISLGPANDCYQPALAPDVAEAALFATRQYLLCVEMLANYGLTRNEFVILHETIGTQREALGICKAAKALNLPLILSFIVDREGYLLDGQEVHESILQIDHETSYFAEGFSLNCCSPFAFERVTHKSQIKRLIGFYPNSWDAHPSSYELEIALEEPDKQHSLQKIAEIGRLYDLKFIGGCCGFDYEDIKNLVFIV